MIAVKELILLRNYADIKLGHYYVKLWHLCVLFYLFIHFNFILDEAIYHKTQHVWEL